MMYHKTEAIHSINPATSIAARKPKGRVTDSFAMEVFTTNCEGRKSAEQFIKQGFNKAYNANISITMPQILTVKNGNFKAALGIRSAKSPLFIEQYLSSPIEQNIPRSTQEINRNDIVEIGSLYSNATRFTLPLFLVTAVSLFYQNYKYLTFAGTSHVLNILSKAGVNFSTIGDAKESALSPSDDDWGSYYDTNPKVVVVALSSVISAIDKQEKYQQLFKSLEEKIASVCKQLGANS